MHPPAIPPPFPTNWVPPSNFWKSPPLKKKKHDYYSNCINDKIKIALKGVVGLPCKLPTLSITTTKLA